MTRYNTDPNRGFERFTNVVYLDLSCKNCHEPSSTGAREAGHDSAEPTFGATVDGSAGHTQSVVTCYNCHFETELQLDQKKAYGQFKDWLFLINNDGKVNVRNFQFVKFGRRRSMPTRSIGRRAPAMLLMPMRRSRNTIKTGPSLLTQEQIDDLKQGR
jgi:hypothetical protein